MPFFPDPPPFEPTSHRETTLTAGIEIAPPTVRYQVEPRYTEAARRIRFQGAVILSLLIDTDGHVADLAVLQSAPFGLTENAVDAVRQWLFAPSTLNGDPVSIRYTLTVRFRLEPSESAANPAVQDLRDTADPPAYLATRGASLGTSAAPDDSSSESIQSDGKTRSPSIPRHLANRFAPVVDLPLLFASIVLFVLAGGAWIMRTVSAALTSRSAREKPIARSSRCRWPRSPSRGR